MAAGGIGACQPDWRSIAAPNTVNVAATCTGTRALGPGFRSVVWVQGCPFRCPHCLAPEWLPDRAARLVAAETLAAELTADPRVDGLTISGGEPMAQAEPLARMLRVVRSARAVTVICYTGYRLERLTSARAPDGASLLLREVDVLIDGLYVAALDDGKGIRGSSNQRIHHLTSRLRGYDFERRPRSAELHFVGDDVHLVGVPPRGLLNALDEFTPTAGSQR